MKSRAEWRRTQGGHAGAECQAQRGERKTRQPFGETTLRYCRTEVSHTS